MVSRLEGGETKGRHTEEDRVVPFKKKSLSAKSAVKLQKNQFISFTTFEFSINKIEMTTMRIPHTSIMLEIVRFRTSANEIQA